MKRNFVKSVLGIAALVGLGVGVYMLLKEDKPSDVPDLDEDDDSFDEDIAEDFDKDVEKDVAFEEDVKKVFDNSVDESNTDEIEMDLVKDVYVKEEDVDYYDDMDSDEDEPIIVGEPSDYEDDTLLEVFGVTREEAIKDIMAKMPEKSEEELAKMINSDLAYLYSITKNNKVE